MKSLITILFLCSCFVAAGREAVIDRQENFPITSTPLQLVPKVNPITGDYIEDAVDLVVAGIEPLSVRRFYSHTSSYEPRYGGWIFNPETYFAANFEWASQPKFATVGDESGRVISLEKGVASYTYGLDIHKQTSTINSDLSGQSHPLNTKISYRKIGDHKDKHRFYWEGEIVDGRGSQRTFSSPKHNWLSNIRVKKTRHSFLTRIETTYRVTPNVWTPYFLRIEEERKPNGNILVYNYERFKEDKDYPKPYLLSSITAYNKDKTKVLGELQFHYKRHHEEVVGIEIEGSDGRKATIHTAGKNPIMLSSIFPASAPETTYHSQGQIIKQVDYPEGRFLRTEYNSANKVAAQYGPYGLIARYDYLNGATESYDGENNKVVYRYDQNHRITASETFLNDRLYRIDRSHWDPETGNLLRRSVEDESGRIYQLVEYTYDKNQNVIEEKIGDGKESYTIYRTYSDDGFNLKLLETDRLGETIRYSYLPNTNLLSSELVYEGSKIRKRTFHFYDDCAVCIKTIVDDGGCQDPEDLCSVSYRKITLVHPKREMPCLGFPETVEEKTIDSFGQEILLHKVTYFYTSFGKVLTEMHYDSNDHYRYTISHTYDSKERVISSTNSLGHEVKYSYDENNNLISLLGPRPDQHQEFTYDLMNRPIQTAEWQTDGSILQTEKKYDQASRIISKTDERGLQTRYSYDSLGRVTTIYYPDGAEIHKEYDLLGNVIKEIDAKGYETRTTYNFRSQPTAIFYPDGSKEYFSYNPKGNLIEYIDKSGSKTHYKYDIFDNVIETKVLSSKDKELKKSSSVYMPFYLLSSTSPEGAITTYTYDFAGRKIAQETEGEKTLFTYDLLSRPSGQITSDVIYITEYDNAGNVIEKTTKDHSLIMMQREQYSYDEAGNCVERITSKGTFTTNFDTKGRPILKKDPLGFTSTFSYSYSDNYIATQSNPKGVQTIHIYDARENEIETLKKTPKGEIIQKTQRIFDKNRNPIQETHVIYSGATLLNILTHKSIFGPLNRIEEIIEADQKVTRFFYDDKGRLSEKIKPDGTTLFHTYDELGRIERYYSTDFDNRYTYDKEDRILSVFEALSKTHTEHTYDRLGHQLQEKLANDLRISHTYDKDGRRIETYLPDGSYIAYTYHANQLHTVSYKGFSHTYKQRDLEGKTIETLLPADLGHLSIERDPLSRIKTLHTPFYHGSYQYDSIGNLSSSTFTDAKGTFTSSYQYDDLNQLCSEADHTYQQDSIHNRLNKDGLDYCINELCQITDDGKTTYEYDQNGNLIFDSEHRFTYDTQDRLICIEYANTKIDYTYDPFHRRLSRTVSINNQKREKQLYLWDGDHEIGAADEKVNLKELRILGEGFGAEIGAAVLIELEGRTYVPIHDQRGCVVTLIDTQTEEPCCTYRYTAFGEEETEGLLSPWRFSSKRVDPETGYLFFGRRYYSPELGKWISPDPQGFADGPNLYAYLHNNPLIYCDPYGLWSNPLRSAAHLFSRASHIGFKGLELTGKHLIPIPGVRDLVEAVGRWGCGGPFLALAEYRENYNRIATIPGEKIDGKSIPYENGMLTTFLQALEQAKQFSLLHGGAEVTLLYNASHGLLCDLLECGIAKLGLTSPYEKMAAHYFSTKLAEDPNHKFITYVHSQAATHMMNTGKLLTSEECQHIHVRSFGGATIIPEGKFGSAYNYISKLDPVSMTSMWGYGKARVGLSSNVSFLKPTSKNPLKEHFLLGDTYYKKMKALGDAFIGEYFND